MVAAAPGERIDRGDVGQIETRGGEAVAVRGGQGGPRLLDLVDRPRGAHDQRALSIQS
jgi:hypothetical protein